MHDGDSGTNGTAAPRVLVIDSYDSFVYNLVQYLGELGADPLVVRNDQLTVDEAVALAPDAVLLSPGPGRPETSGIICDAIGAFAALGTPVFGVCLGHQAIGHVYGADVVGAPELMHGKTSPILHDGAGVFAGLPSPLTATRYHSLTLAPDSIPDELVVTARAPTVSSWGCAIARSRWRVCSSTRRASSPGTATSCCARSCRASA